MGLGRDGTSHGAYEFRSSPFLLDRAVSNKAGKIKFRYFQMGVPSLRCSLSQSLLDTDADSYHSKVFEGNGMNRNLY